MKRFIKNSLALCTLLACGNAVGVENYYKLLGIKEITRGSELRKACVAKEIFAKKAVESAERVYKNISASSVGAKRTAERSLNEAREKLAKVKEGCRILASPSLRGNYDDKLAEQVGREKRKSEKQAAQERLKKEGKQERQKAKARTRLAKHRNYYELIGVSPTASKQEIITSCARKSSEVSEEMRKKRLVYDRTASLPRASKTQLDDLRQSIELLEQQKEEIPRVCEILKDDTKRVKYNKDLALQKEGVTPTDTGAKDTQTGKREGTVGETALNFYDFLNVRKAATKEEIDSVCRTKARGATGQTKRDLERACATLQDPVRRTAYDKALALQRETGKPLEGSDLFIEAKKAQIKSRFGDTDVYLFEDLGNFLSEVEIPDAGGRVFNANLGIKDMRFIAVPPMPGKVRKGLGFTGTVKINNVNMKATVIIAQDPKRKTLYSLSIALPQHYKISDMFPQFKKLDTLSLPRAKLVLSTFPHTDPEGYSIKKGLNFVSSLDLTGPLAILNKLKNRAKSLKSIIVEVKPIRFQGVIPRNITQTSFTAEIPLRLGVDFTAAKFPRSFTKIFKEFTTDDFNFSVSAPPKVTFNIESGVRLVLATQPDPLRFSAFGIVEPTSFSLGFRMRNMLDLGIIALGNGGIQFDFDDQLLPAALLIGIPFTGLGINGQLDVGQAEDKATFRVAGGARISAAKLPDIVLEVSASNIRFGSIVALLSKMAAKAKVGKEIPASKIPIMDIISAGGYLVLEDTRIAQREYYAGFGFNLDAQLFDKKFGFSVDVQHKALRLSGRGYIPIVEFKRGNDVIVRMAGSEFGDQGMEAYCSFDAKNPLVGTFGLNTFMEIPPVKLKQKVNFEVSAKRFRAEIDVIYVGFTAIFGIDIDPKRWKEMYVTFGFRDDFEGFLTKQAKPAIEKLKSKAAIKLAEIDKKIGELSRELEKLKKQGVGVTQAEINRARKQIQDSRNRIDLLESQCKKKSLILCPTINAKVTAEKSKLAAHEIYLKTLLKPGKVVFKGVTGAFEKAARTLADAEVFKTSITELLTGFSKAIDGIAKGLKIFKVTEAIGEYNAQELARGKLPRLTRLKVEVIIPEASPIYVNLSNLQFDFKNPVASGKEIVEQIFKNIQIGDKPLKGTSGLSIG